MTDSLPIALTYPVSKFPYMRLISWVNIKNNETGISCSARALWDTGAATSILNKSVAEELRLELKKDKNTSVVTAFGSGSSQASTAFIGVCIGGLYIETPVLIIDDAQRSFSETEIVIGLDFIAKGNLSVFTDKLGVPCFSFTYPPRFDIDFKRMLDSKGVENASQHFFKNGQ